MELAAHISFRPAHTDLKVLIMKIMRYLQTGYLLHLMAIFSMYMVFLFGRKFLLLWNNGLVTWGLLLHGYLCLYFFSLIIFSILDARSRYQNYKMAKDRLFKYGFDARLLKPFVYSRCQRDAIGVAVKDLKFETEWKILKKTLGFQWFHLFPDMVVKKPRTLFCKAYWSKTLFVPRYQSKYFLW